MIQRREHPRFALEASKTFSIAYKDVGQDLDRHVAPEFRIAGTVHLAPPAGTEAR